MPVEKLFGTKELIKALQALNFTPRKQHSSSHQFWRPDASRKLRHGQRPFMTVVHKKGHYSRRTCSNCIRQLMNLGYSIQEINKAFGWSE